MLGVVLARKPDEAAIFLRDFARDFFRPGYNYWLVGLLSAAPFVALSALWLFLGPGMENHKTRRFGIAGATLALLLVALAVEIAVWWNVLGPHPDAQSVIALLLAPFYSAVALPVGYGIGALAGAMTDRAGGRA